MFKESIKMSLQNIISNKMRSFLTVLGIVIGVASIIALITIVKGVTQSVTSTVSDMGANKISIQVKGTPLKKGLSNNEVNEISKIDNIKGMAPTITGKATIIYNGTDMDDISIQGKNQVHFNNTKDLVASGRPINILDCNSKNTVCLIGQDIVDKFFKAESPINKEIIVNGIRYTIIGTLEKSQGFAAGGNNKSIIIPYTTAMSLLGINDITSVDVYINNGDLSDTTTSQIENAMHSAFNGDEDGYVVSNMQEIIDKVKEMTGTMSLMLGGVASISLIVGGIGIMNMMLVSVTERTREIGLRKALGAEPKKIELQFIIEAIFLSLFGGVLGVLIGVGVSYGVCSLIGTSLILSWSTIMLAIGFSFVIGVVFGLAPARKASKLNPIDALRSS